MKKELKKSAEFPKIYKYVFSFLKGELARNVNVDHAIHMWKILLTEFYGESINPFLEKWEEFLENQKEVNKLNGIKKDEWMSLLELLKSKGIDVDEMSGSEEECWPILFDSFFEFLKK